QGERGLFAALAVLALVGCTCDTRTSRRQPKLEVPSDDGAERTFLDFGTVQVGLEHTLPLRIRNGGATALTLSALEAAAPFGSTTPLPLTVGVGEETQLVVSFKPTQVNRRVTGQLTLRSDDPQRPSVLIDLAGTGITAVAVASPNPLAFGDVYVGERKTVTLTVSNAGSKELQIHAAQLDSSAPPAPVMSADWTPLLSTLAAGASVSVDITFAPAQMLEVAGALELTLDPLQGGTLRVPLQGRGVLALPRVCFQPEGAGTANCTDPTEAAPNLPVRFLGLCDQSLFGDAGVNSCASGASQGRGQLFVKNEGNVPVAYSMRYEPYPYTKDRCDAGYPALSDFTFSNVPQLADGGVASPYVEPTASLPEGGESQKVTVQYTARSRCRDEGTDLARVVWTRQNEPASHTPATILVTMDGTSKLPWGVPSDWNCGSLAMPATPPCKFAFYGVNNSGDAPLKVTQVELVEEVPQTDGGLQFQSCASAGPTSPCRFFGWEAVDGGDPNQYAPHDLPATTNPAQPTQKALGTLVFGPQCSPTSGPGTCPTPNQLYRIHAEVHTDDPYGPIVRARMAGVASLP
ncbi:MAG: choice-of-anchor D domain-containing protein, partial [Myxococcota bacterium]